VSQARLRGILGAAIAAAQAHPDWAEGDELCIVAADADATVMTTRGFAAPDLLDCLDQMTADVRAATREQPGDHGPAEDLT
jgi:hypothetical protein